MRKCLGKLIHEFHISYSHTEWNLLPLLRKNIDKICEQSSVKLNSKINIIKKVILPRTSYACTLLTVGEGGCFFIFRLFKSILFFVN